MFFFKIKSWPAVGLSFHWDAFDIERMAGEKMISSSFGRVAVPGMRAPGARVGKP
jgi:hypothetical protein